MRAVRAGLDACRRVRGAIGQGLVEYGLILSLIVLVALIALTLFPDAIAAALQVIGDEIDRASR